jgi:protocatechuate 3,4-dioxygenase alpha subunit
MPRPTLPETPLAPTPSQTVGPFFGYALPYEEGPFVVAPDHPEALRLRGRVTDGEGAPVPDALLEVCLPDGSFGRCPTDEAGRYEFCLPGGSVRAARYVAVLVFARGLLKPVATRAYLTEEPTDPLLSDLDPVRRSTLVTVPEPDGAHRFDVRLQGEGETVFLDLT